MLEVQPIVTTVRGIEPTRDRWPAQGLPPDGIAVELGDGQRLRLDPREERTPGFARLFEGLAAQGLHVYLELDPDSGRINRLLIPIVSRVERLYPIADDILGVALEQSHARHLLRRDLPRGAALEEQLRRAADGNTPVIVTEDDSHTIIDVRPGPKEGPLPPLGEAPPRPFGPTWFRPIWLVIHRILWWRWWPWWWPWWWFLWWWFWPWNWFHCVSAARAQQIFNAMSATTCSPLTVIPPCIPFMYPDDGCWGRAHEMRRLIVNMGHSSKKVWIQGWLHASTRNNPSCGVNWGWHVAPTICVRGPWFFQRQDMVIDPSLFTGPVTKATWKSVQGDPNATLTDSAGSIFYLWGMVTDPSYSQTNTVLATYRLQLLNRSLTSVGPPPYASCP